MEYFLGTLLYLLTHSIFTTSRSGFRACFLCVKEGGLSLSELMLSKQSEEGKGQLEYFLNLLFVDRMEEL